MLHIQINNIFQSESFLTRPRCPSVMFFLSFNLESFQSFQRFHHWLPRPRSVKKKATWISAEIETFFCSRSNVCAISSASFNATRPFCFTLVTVLRASTLVPTYVTSYITYTHLILTFSSRAIVNRRTSPRKSDSSCPFL